MSPGEIDRRVVQRHLRALREAVAVLRRHVGVSVERLTDDADERWAVERGLQLSAQNALDVATHIVASSGGDVPDYTSAIDALGRIGVVPRDFAASFRDLAGFRNVLVHGYLEVDLNTVHQVLEGRLDDLVEFADLVEQYLDRA